MRVVSWAIRSQLPIHGIDVLSMFLLHVSILLRHKTTKTTNAQDISKILRSLHAIGHQTQRQCLSCTIINQDSQPNPNDVTVIQAEVRNICIHVCVSICTLRRAMSRPPSTDLAATNMWPDMRQHTCHHEYQSYWPMYTSSSTRCASTLCRKFCHRNCCVS